MINCDKPWDNFVSKQQNDLYLYCDKQNIYYTKLLIVEQNYDFQVVKEQLWFDVNLY